MGVREVWLVVKYHGPAESIIQATLWLNLLPLVVLVGSWTGHAPYSKNASFYIRS